MTDNSSDTGSPSKTSRFGLSDVDPRSRLEKQVRESKEELIKSQKELINEQRRMNSVLVEMVEVASPKRIHRKNTENARRRSAENRAATSRLIKQIAREKGLELWRQFPRHNRDQIAGKLVNQVPALKKYSADTVSDWLKGLSPRSGRGNKDGVAVSQLRQRRTPR